MPKVSIKSVVRTAKAEDAKTRKTVFATKDSLQNFAANLGIGTDNLLSASTYGFNPITRNRTLLEWIHRGSWLGGVAIDIVGDDMTRAGIEVTSDVKPEDREILDEAVIHYQLWSAINDTERWARLYGGCIAIILID